MKFNLKNFYLEVFLKVWDQNLKPNFRSFKWGTCCLCIFDIIGATGNFVKCAGKKRVFLIGTVIFYYLTIGGAQTNLLLQCSHSIRWTALASTKALTSPAVASTGNEHRSFYFHSVNTLVISKADLRSVHDSTMCTD